MEQIALHLKENIGEYLFKIFLSLAGLWILFTLCFQLFFVYLQFSDKSELESNISKEIMWKIDGTFKNSPGNIWYNDAFEA